MREGGDDVYFYILNLFFIFKVLYGIEIIVLTEAMLHSCSVTLHQYL